MEVSKLSSLERLRKLLDLRMTDPNILENLIRESVRHAQEFTKAVSEQLRTANSILKRCAERIELVTSLSRSVGNESVRCVGVDGSKQVVGGSTSRFYIMIASSIVILPHGLKTKYPIVNQAVAPIVKYASPHPEDVGSLSEDLMMIWETLTLGKVLELLRKNNIEPQGTLTFVDGPIIDPPRELKEESKYYLSQILRSLGDISPNISNDVSELVEKFHEIRASIIKELLNEGVIIIGYVKRPFTESLLLKLLVKEGCADLAQAGLFNGDKELAYALLMASHHEFPKATKFMEYTAENELYALHYAERFKIVYSYLLADLRSNVSRVEIVIPKSFSHNIYNSQELLHVILNNVVSLIPPGAGYPLPVILAHDKCNIRKGVAEILYEEVITQGLSLEAYDPTLLLMKLKMT